jgi:hypothetical protein
MLCFILPLCIGNHLIFTTVTLTYYIFANVRKESFYLSIWNFSWPFLTYISNIVINFKKNVLPAKGYDKFSHAPLFQENLNRNFKNRLKEGLSLLGDLCLATDCHRFLIMISHSWIWITKTRWKVRESLLQLPNSQETPYKLIASLLSFLTYCKVFCTNLLLLMDHGEFF